MTHDLVPRDPKFDRKALERIIHRAAELHTGQKDLAEQLTQEDVLELGKEVGIPPRYLQQAMMEERTRAETFKPGNFVTNITGPKRISASRTVVGEAGKLKEALDYWMTTVELLMVKRRYPDGTSFERRKDIVASMKRGMGLGGRRYDLSRAKDIQTRIEPLEDGWSHVTLVADLSNSRAEHIAGGASLLGVGAAGTTVGIVLGVAIPVAIIPVAAGMAGGYAVARANRSTLERVQLNMEQVLDKLERGEISPPKSKQGAVDGGDFVKKIASEIREIGRQFTD